MTTESDFLHQSARFGLVAASAHAVAITSSAEGQLHRNQSNNRGVLWGCARLQGTTTMTMTMIHLCALCAISQHT